MITEGKSKIKCTYFFKKSKIELERIAVLLISIIFGFIILYGLWRILINAFSQK